MVPIGTIGFSGANACELRRAAGVAGV